MGDNLTIRVARKGQTPVASILTISNNKTVVYKYGCSDSCYSNLGGTAMLFWNAIREAKAEGMEELDMGRTSPDNSGLITYKEHWGAKRSIVNYWRYPPPTYRSVSGSTLKYLNRIVSITPDPVLVLLGRVLYRHIG
jgi:lipid II:glycine glycyltransferase (peptidoglycan interpeptide bridge formation enzyme)